MSARVPTVQAPAVEVVRRFGSWLAFVDAATDKRPLPDAGRRSRDSDARFHGTSTWEEAVELARSMRISPVGTAVGGNGRSFGLALDAIYDVSGAEVDMGRYLSGDPENMVVYTLRPAPHCGRVVALQVDVGAEWDVPCAKIRSQGAAAFGLADALRAYALGLDVYVTERVVSPSSPSRHSWQTVVKVQCSDEPFDASRIEFALTHPAMLRRLMFSLAELETDYIRQLFRFFPGGSYGVPQPRALPHVDVYLPRHRRLAAHGGTEGWIESQLQRLGVTT